MTCCAYHLNRQHSSCSDVYEQYVYDKVTLRTFAHTYGNYKTLSGKLKQRSDSF